MYGIPVFLVGTAIGGKLAYDFYQDYAERHRLLKPWRGEMIKIEGVNALQAPPTTLMGIFRDTLMIAGALNKSNHRSFYHFCRPLVYYFANSGD